MSKKIYKVKGEAVSRRLSPMFKNYQKKMIVKGVRGSSQRWTEECWEVKGGMFDDGRNSQGK